MRKQKGRGRVIAPTGPVRGDTEVLLGELLVAVATKFRLMAGAAQLRVGAGRDGVGDTEIGTVDIDHRVGKGAHLVGRFHLMAIETELLFVTGGALRFLGLGGQAMLHGPVRAMGLQPGEGDLVDEFLIMAVEAHLPFGFNFRGLRKVAGRTGRGVGVNDMDAVIEIGRSGRQHR